MSFQGSITALVTPFKNGKVDEKALARLVRRQIELGTDGLVPVGTTGESPTLNYEEPDQGLDLDYVVEGTKPLPNGDTPAIGISNSFGFGGHNAVLCLEAS